jgi:hypothetical protein
MSELVQKLLELSNEVSKISPKSPYITLQLPYDIRQCIINECSHKYSTDEFRGRTSFTLYGNIHIEPPKYETEALLRKKVERARKSFEDAQKEYKEIIGETNG